MLEEIQLAARNHEVIAASRLYKVRAAQLMLLRKGLHKDLKIIVVKNRIAQRALKESGLSEIDRFADALEGQNALIFTNIDPFKLYLILEKSRVNMPAKAGDVATDEIIIPAGNTGLPPGPVLSEFKEAGVPTRIDTGSIWVNKDTVVAHPGDIISPKLAGLLSKLGLKPIRAGISINQTYFDGVTLEEKDVRIDPQQYLNSIKEAFTSGFKLALEASYPTQETIPILIGNASMDARSLAVQSGYVTSETVRDTLSLAEARAKTILEKAKEKGYAGS